MHAVVSGRVQGVGFRWSARAEAQRLGVSGWVRNLPDGTVEAEVEGDEGSVAGMLAWLHRGPPGSHVTGVQTETLPASGATGFEVR